jgi:hypothetical protein
MTEWIGKLGAINQSRGVPYIENSSCGEVRCLLCGTGWMSPSSRKTHFNGSTHAKSYRRVQEAERLQRRHQENELTQDKIQNMKEVEIRVHRLGLCKWRDSLKSHMYEYIVYDAVIGYNTVIVKLRQFERMECASLLELAFGRPVFAMVVCSPLWMKCISTRFWRKTLMQLPTPRSVLLIAVAKSSFREFLNSSKTDKQS